MWPLCEDDAIGFRFFARLLIFAAGVLVGLVTLLTLDRLAVWPIDLLANFRVQLLEVAVLLTLIAALLRARIAFVICAIAAVVNGAVVVPSFTGSQPAAVRGGPTLTMGHLNAQSGTINVVALRSYLRATDPGLFVILNPNPSTVQALDTNAAGYAVIPVSVNGSHFAWVLVLTRVPIFGIRHPLQPGMPKAAMEAVVELGATEVAVLFLHTESPYTPSRNDQLHRALAAAARWSARGAPAPRGRGRFQHHAVVRRVRHAVAERSPAQLARGVRYPAVVPGGASAARHPDRQCAAQRPAHRGRARHRPELRLGASQPARNHRVACVLRPRLSGSQDARRGKALQTPA